MRYIRFCVKFAAQSIQSRDTPYRPLQCYFGEVAAHVDNDLLDPLVHMFIVEITRHIPPQASSSVHISVPFDLMSQIRGEDSIYLKLQPLASEYLVHFAAW